MPSFLPRPLPPLTDLLDVRPANAPSFVEGAVRIPLSELKERLSELPRREDKVRIARVDGSADEAVRFLRKGDREAWSEAEFRLVDPPQSFRLWRPNEFLEERLPSLPGGTALDLGSGAGRESVALAAAGYAVTAVDVLDDCLERCRSLAARYSVEDRIHLTERVPEESFNLLCAFFYFDRNHLRTCLLRMRPGSHVVIEAFTPKHAQIHGKPLPQRTIDKEELAQFWPLWEIVSLDDGMRLSRRHTVRLHAVLQ